MASSVDVLFLEIRLSHAHEPRRALNVVFAEKHHALHVATFGAAGLAFETQIHEKPS
jgi:hypothetical protein